MISLRSFLVFITLLVAVSAGTSPEGVAFLTKKAAEEGYVERFAVGMVSPTRALNGIDWNGMFFRWNVSKILTLIVFVFCFVPVVTILELLHSHPVWCTRVSKENCFVRANPRNQLSLPNLPTSSHILFPIWKKPTELSPGTSSDKKAKINTPCVCHYSGTLIDGTEVSYGSDADFLGSTHFIKTISSPHSFVLFPNQFDSSYKRGQPLTFAPNQVIKGWTEALQLMDEGAKVHWWSSCAILLISLDNYIRWLTFLLCLALLFIIVGALHSLRVGLRRPWGRWSHSWWGCFGLYPPIARDQALSNRKNCCRWAVDVQ